MLQQGGEKCEEDEDEDVLPPYQDDHEALLRPKAAGALAMAASATGPTQMSRESKTTSRTYTDPEGNVITEVCDYSSHSGALCSAAVCLPFCLSHAMERSPSTQMNCESKTTPLLH